MKLSFPEWARTTQIRDGVSYDIVRGPIHEAIAYPRKVRRYDLRLTGRTGAPQAHVYILEQGSSEAMMQEAVTRLVGKG